MPTYTNLVTAFVRDIQGNLYPDNEFYKRSLNDSNYIKGDSVELPQAGTKPSTVKNPTQFPLPVNVRVDSADGYKLDLFATLPSLCKFDEDMIYAYDKRADVTRDHEETLRTEIAENFIDVWAPTNSANILFTTGSGEAVRPDGASGNRKAITKADFTKVFAAMAKQKIKMNDAKRCALFPADMYAQLQNIPEFIDYSKTGIPQLIVEGKIAGGQIGRLMGFDIYARSTAGIYTADGATYKSISDPVVSTDCYSAIFWHEDFVRRAEGVVTPFINEAQAAYLGSILNFAVRAGGSKARTDQKGVIALVQGT